MVAFPHCIDSRVQKEEERLSFFLAITLPNENPWTLFPIALPSSFPFYKVPSFLRQALTCRCKIAILSWSLYAPPPKKKIIFTAEISGRYLIDHLFYVKKRKLLGWQKVHSGFGNPINAAIIHLTAYFIWGSKWHYFECPKKIFWESGRSLSRVPKDTNYEESWN